MVRVILQMSTQMNPKVCWASARFDLPRGLKVPSSFLEVRVSLVQAVRGRGVAMVVEV